MSDMPDVSLVIATYLRGEDLVRCVESVLAHETSHRMELLVIDQTPSQPPGVAERLTELSGDPRLRYVPAEPPSLPGARNLGTTLARAEIVVFVDDDVQLDPGFLDAHVVAHRSRPGLAGVAGRVRTLDGRPVTDFFRIDRLGRNHGEFDFPFPRPATTARGCNMSFKRSWLLQVGGFDTRFAGNAYREESDLCYRVRQHGGEIQYVPDASLLHHEAGSGGCREASPIHDRPLAYQNEVLFLRKHWPAWALPALLVANYFTYVLTRYTVKSGRVLLRSRAWLRGVAAGLRVAGQEGDLVVGAARGDAARQ